MVHGADHQNSMCCNGAQARYFPKRDLQPLRLHISGWFPWRRCAPMEASLGFDAEQQQVVHISRLTPSAVGIDISRPTPSSSSG